MASKMSVWNSEENCEQRGRSVPCVAGPRYHRARLINVAVSCYHIRLQNVKAIHKLVFSQSAINLLAKRLMLMQISEIITQSI